MARSPIPFFDLRSQARDLKGPLTAAWERVLRNGRYVLGPEVEALEKDFSARCGVSHGVGVGSGTEALHIALAACGVGPGDEVITVSHTATATAAAIRLAGAVPVFVDVDPSTWTMDPLAAAKAVTRKTKALLPVHLYGCPADLSSLRALARRKGIALVEDAAQAHGASYKGRPIGAWGDAGCFSFYPTKNLGALGDGGMVVTSSASLAKKMRALREYGWEERYVSSAFGWNSRLDELQAAFLRVKALRLKSWVARRRALAARYRKLLSGCPGIALPADAPGHAHHLFVIRAEKRDALRKFLDRRGVQTLVHYPVPVHLQPAYARHRRAGSLAVTERLAREILSLPLYPEMPAGSLERVCREVRAFYEG